MNKRGSSWIFYLLILTALCVGFAVNSVETFNIETFKQNLTWTPVEINAIEQPDLSKALESLTNGFGETAFHLLKWMAQWSSENPTIPYKTLLFLALFAIFAPIALVLFKFIIILIILIKEWIQSSREKRKIKQLKMKGGKK